VTNAIVPAPDAALATVEHAVLHVVFRVDTAEYALPASTVLQLESYTGATPVPGAAPYVAGIVQLRGKVIPVVDLRARFGLPAKEPTLDTRVVVGEVASRVVALVADSAREVVRIAPSQEKPPPHLVDGGENRVVRAVVQLGDRTILLLDLAKLIGEETSSVQR